MTHPPEPKEEEGLSFGKIVAVAVVALVVFAAGVLWVEMILRPQPAAREASEVGRAEVGIVNQRPFDVEKRAEALRTRDLQRLSTWGWIDPQTGRVHAPIEHAMDALVAESAAEGGAQ